MRYRYKINGAGNLFRKYRNRKSECFYQNQWIKTNFRGEKDSWNLEVLKTISKDEAMKILNKNKKLVTKGNHPLHLNDCL